MDLTTFSVWRSRKMLGKEGLSGDVWVYLQAMIVHDDKRGRSLEKATGIVSLLYIFPVNADSKKKGTLSCGDYLRREFQTDKMTKQSPFWDTQMAFSPRLLAGEQRTTSSLWYALNGDTTQGKRDAPLGSTWSHDVCHLLVSYPSRKVLLL